MGMIRSPAYHYRSSPTLYLSFRVSTPEWCCITWQRWGGPPCTTPTSPPPWSPCSRRSTCTATHSPSRWIWSLEVCKLYHSFCRTGLPPCTTATRACSMCCPAGSTDRPPSSIWSPPTKSISSCSMPASPSRIMWSHTPTGVGLNPGPVTYSQSQQTTRELIGKLTPRIWRTPTWRCVGCGSDWPFLRTRFISKRVHSMLSRCYCL